MPHDRVKNVLTYEVIVTDDIINHSDHPPTLCFYDIINHSDHLPLSFYDVINHSDHLPLSFYDVINHSDHLPLCFLAGNSLTTDNKFVNDCSEPGGFYKYI